MEPHGGVNHAIKQRLIDHYSKEGQKCGQHSPFLKAHRIRFRHGLPSEDRRPVSPIRFPQSTQSLGDRRGAVVLYDLRGSALNGEPPNAPTVAVHRPMADAAGIDPHFCPSYAQLGQLDPIVPYPPPTTENAMRRLRLRFHTVSFGATGLVSP